MSFRGLLNDCQARDIKLAVKNGKLLLSDEKGNLTAELKQALSLHKAAIITWLQGSDSEAIARRDGLAEYPLSFSQQRLWFIDQLGGSTQYNVPSAFALNGRLDEAALQQSLDAVVARHAVLRTVFRLKDGEPVQCVREFASVAVERIDLGSLGEDEQRRQVRALLAAERTTPFDLGNDLMLRCRLLRLGHDSHVVLFTMHHIAADGWSLGVLIKEFVEGYEAFGAGRQPVLPELPIQYADFAHWQREAMRGGLVEAELAYWKEALDGIPSVHRLPLDKPRPAEQRFEAQRHGQRLDKALSDGLQQLGRAHNATLFMVLQSAFAAVLQRFSGDGDIVMGVPHAGRAQKELAPLIGFFVNTLVFRSQLRSDLRVSELLAQGRQTALDAFAHSHVPFDLLGDALRHERSLAYNPLCQIKFVLQNFEAGELKLPGLQLAPVEQGSGRVHFDLDLTATESADGIQLSWTYKDELFDRTSIENLAKAYRRLLQQMVAHPYARLNELDWLDADDAQRLRSQGQGPQSTVWRELPLPQQFEQQVLRTPQAIALRCGADELSYADLDAKASRLAHALIEQGVAAGARVGVHLERSLELLIALLAVQKSGAAYVMLDHKQTPERLQAILADAGVTVALLDSRRSVLPVGGVDTLYLDDAGVDAQWLAEYPSTQPDIAIAAADSAYVLYTSGSTGTPKGVEILHRGLTDYCAFAREGYYAASLSGSLVVTSPAFDLTVPSLYVPLLTGGCVELIAVDDDLAGFAARLEQADIPPVLLRLTPSHLQGLLQLADETPRQTAHVFVIGGEAFGVDLARQLQAKYPQAQIYNHYGPTETVVGCSWYDVTANLADLQRTIPIGRPMSNTALYVLDGQGRLQPPGVAGELYIGGAGVAKGYINQPELTAAKFVADPFEAGGRLYRSGDRVRWRHDGTLEFLGRLDDQVKLRGFRIELGDIESALRRHASVRDAVAVVRGDHSEARLVAYVAAEAQDEAALVEQLKTQLAAQLPSYMQPSAYAVLPRLPLTPNGKVDKAALPEPERQAQVFVAPQGETETTLAAIWARVLKLDAISREANFFDLGGHSLLATRVVSEIGRTLAKPLPVRALFEHPVLADLAAHIGQQASAGYAAIPPAARDTPLPLSFAQQRLWFIDRLEGGSTQYNMPVALRLQGELDTNALQQALDALVARHEVLRTHYVEVDGTALQVIAAPDSVPVQRHDLRELAADAREARLQQLAHERATHPFDLSRDLKLRCALVQLGERDNALLFAMHHIASDGWSLGVLVREFVALYGEWAQGRTPRLPALAVQYADFAAWQRQRLQGTVLQAHLDYWRGQLADLPAVHSLPLDRPRPARQQFDGGRLLQDVDAATLAGLNALARRHDASLFMLLQAAFALLVARWSGESDIVIGTPIAGRLHPDVEPLIGFFVNTLVLRSDLSANPTFEQLLAQARATALAAYEHQEIPFEMLVDELKPARSLAHAPLFQLMFTLQNNEQSALVLPGLSLAPLASRQVPAKFDLELAASESAQGLKLSWNYAKSLFDAATIARLGDSFGRLLQGIVTAPQQPVLQLPLLSPGERAQVVQAFNDTAADLGAEALVHQLFEAQAAREPAAAALRFEGEQLSYAQLNARANQLAHRLLALGVKPDDRVAVCMQRSVELVVALLAVLKAGAAYVPLDPDYPSDRLAYLLGDCTPVAVLTQGEIAVLPLLQASRLPLLLADSAALDGQPEHNPQVAGLGPRHLAYVIYTSGSTGQPKGVMNEHAGVVNRLRWAQSQFALSAADRVLQKTPYSFDVSVWEFFLPLLAGACLVVARPQGHQDPAYLIELIDGEGITLAHFVPSMLQVFIDQADAVRCRSLRQVKCSGEALPYAAQQRFAQVLPQAQLYNLYGPTEAAVDVTWWRCDGSVHAGIVPIGRPVANTQMYVLDAQRQPVPVGVTGELYIGGIQVARGYIGRAQLTAERFVADPFSAVPNARLYKTGDLGRWLADGSIEYLGRNDFQVKIRGFRIELGEIEAALLACAGVREAVVVAREDVPGEKRVVAYLVAAQADDLVERLRVQLAARLPAYMLPAAFVLLPALPLNSNGKVDRRQLPAPDYQAQELYVAPANAVEARLAEIWQQLLRVEQVGVHDNFFQMGGDSILSIQVVARANQAGIHITTRQLFEAQTIAELARLAASQAAVAAPQDAIDGVLPLLPIQQRFLDGDERDRHHFNQAVLLQTPSGFDAAALQALVAAIYRRHDALRLRFTRVDDQWQARHVPLDATMLADSCVVEPLPLQPAEQAAFVTARCSDWQTRFDLAQGPLLRAVLFAPADAQDSGRLLLAVHHIVMDGVSWRVLLADLEQAYAQHSRGEPIALRAKTSSLQQWSNSLVDYANSDDLQQERAYWLAQNDLAPAPLPLDRPTQGEGSIASTRSVTLGLDAEETRALLQECPAAYRTQVNELLLAGVFLGMREWTGSDGLRLRLEGHGREALFDQLDVTQTVGWFTSLFPLTLHCAETDTGALVKAVKEQYRAIPHHGIGYGLLRYLAAEPLPACDDDAVLEFNYLGQFDQVLGADTRFQAGRESSGAQVSPQRRRPARLSLIGKVFGGQLQFSLNYSAEQYDEANMRGLAALLENALRRVVAHCRMPGVGSYTLSDFPLARITAAQLDDWQMRYPALSRLYPATPMQAGLLFESLVDATTYVVQMMPVLQGELDLPAFRAAWQQTVQRHDALRTAFVGEGAALHQLVWDQAELPWHEEDWCGLDDVEQTRRFEAYRRRDKQAGFDFVRPPLLRLAVFRLGAQRYQLLWTYHHILSDGWSSPLVYRDVVALYQAQLQGLPAPLPPPPAYERYIAWLQRQDAEQARAHWRSLLADVDAPTPLVLDTLPGDGSHGPREQRLLLSVAETDALRALAQSQHTTVNTLLQWSWAYLLHRYSGEARVLFGATISGRAAEVAGIEQMVGLFINTIPVKVEFDGRRSVAESLRTLQQDFQRSNDYGFLSLVDMQRQSALRSGVSLFDSLLVFENYPLDAMTEAADAASGGAAAARLRIERSSSNEQTSYALTLNASLDRSLQVKCGYRAEDFAAATIERLLGHLAAVLRQLPAAVQHNRRIELLQDSERRQLQDWNATQQDYARDATIHALFEAQVQRHPGAIALVHGSESLSYAELNRRANRLARRLVALGAQVDGRVAICLERGVDMIVALLASLKAGSAYVPLDPRYPPERLAYMLADAAPSVLLTQAALRDSLPVLAAGAAPLLLLDGEDLSALADSDLHVAGLAASSLAYVIYTSGSTGQPKGVEQTHRTMVNLMTSLFSRHAVLAQPLPTLQFATLNFDMSLYEVCNALFTGSALVLIDEDDRLDFDRLFALIAREQVGRVYLPTALLQPFAHAALAQQVRLPALKLMQVAGEQLTITPTIRDWARHSGCAVLNLYGPTESHVVSDQLLEGDAVNWATLPPVGKPVANMQMQILDAQLSAVPVGIAGELYLSGDGLARGYLDRPALTAERFIEPVQDGGDRIRLYKTGDLARWLPDGTVEYLGRNDFQVKIHGFRIELGEIEARLVACAGVREAAVVALDDGPAGKRLVAYVVAQDAAQLQPAELRAALARELPDYMIPAAFVSLPALPLTANGKVDRRALPAPDAALLPGRAYAPPQGDIESAIAAVWQELLGLDQVGRDDHFFELGGHSLLVISLIERLRQRGFSLGVKAVFAAPTVRALAEVLAGAAGEAAFEVAPNRLDAATTQITPELLPLVELSQPAIDGIVAAVPGGTANIQDIYPLAPLQEGILFHHLLGGSGDAYLLRRVVGFDSRERLDAFLQALQTVIDRHDILRSAVFWQGLPKPVQVVHRRAPLPLHELALADDVPALEQLLARTDPRRTRLDLQQAPVIAAYVVPDAQSGEWLLALLNHHMVCDHVTLDLMIGEIHCLLQGQGDRLAEPLPYRNFIARTHTVPEAVHEAYFRAQLGDIDTPVAPFGVLDVQSDAQAVSEVRIALDDNLAQRIREQSRRCGVTPAVLFHVAWAQVLGRCTGLDDVVFGTVLSGRLQGSEGADQVVGLFINTLPLRVGLAGIGVRDAVAEVYRRLGELLTHEQASLALAQRCSAVSPALPLFTALLNYRHIHNIGTPADMAWQGMRSLDASARNSYPLTMSVEDRGQAFGLTAQCQQGIDGAHLAGYLESVIAALVDKLESDPAFPLNRLELLPSAQHQQLLVQGRGPASLRWRGLALPLQIEQQVQRTPQAVALRCGDTQLSYAQLDARANRLAHALIEQGIGRGARVGIHRERSPELLIALLAVLKTGAAYVVLDHRQTTARLRAIIADAGVSVALLDSRHSVLPVGGVDALYLDDAATDAQWLAEYPSTRPDIAIADDDSAYVLYTSGSTGTPKGVEILHRGLTDYCAFAREGYYAASLSGSLVVTSPAFDLTVPSLYVPLLTGGCVELIAADDDLAGFAARLEQADMPPVLLRLTPSHLQGLLQLADEAPRQTAHVFVIGGEAFGVDLARQLQAKYPQAQIYNHYGPTETVVGCSWYDVTANLADLQRTIPIGRAMSNTSLYVLDPQARLQPPGVAGELYIGGAGVAKGYLNQPELTAAKFVADPFEAGGRLYRSGDRVRWRHDGTLEFLGRLDDQVKLRGFRIELGDIESALRRHTSVRDAVAVVREGGEGGEAQLVAYVVADPADGLADSLKAQLAEQLPAYMQPSAYVVLARLPLTPNGKVDKGALPRPEQQAKQYISPETETEKILAAVWAGLLGLDVGRIGAGDNFFELGGHSILSIRLVVQLGERFPLPLGVRDLFRYPELRQLAAYLDTATPLRDGAWNPLVLLGSQQAGAALYCVPAAGLTAASYQALAQALQPQLALNVFEPRGFDAAQPPCADMDEIVRCNLQALREHQPRGPYHLAGHSFGGGVAFEMARELEAQGEQVELLLLDSMLYLQEQQRGGRSALSHLRQMFADEDEATAVADTPASDAAFRARFEGRLRQAGLLPLRGDDALLDKYIAAFDTQLALYSAYRPSGLLQGPVSLLLAKGGLARLDRDALVQHYGRCCAQLAEVAVVAGGHLSMLSPEHVQSLAWVMLQHTQAMPAAVVA